MLWMSRGGSPASSPRWLTDPTRRLEIDPETDIVLGRYEMWELNAKRLVEVRWTTVTAVVERRCGTREATRLASQTN